MPIVRLPRGSLRDEIRQPIYDTITLTNSSTITGYTQQFFSSVAGKGPWLTNLRQNNLLETAVSFRVMGLAIDSQNFYYDNVGVLPILIENSSIRLHIGEKDYWQGPLTFLTGRLSASFGLSVSAAGVTTTIDRKNVYQRYGDQAVQGVVLQGKHVVDINPLQSFFAEWTIATLQNYEASVATPAANTNCKVTFSMKGLLRRPVQ